MSEPRPISEYSRQELYNLVWSTPASKLAADFGISDVAIAKRCKKLNVPRPSPGYWAKLEAGRSPAKPPLPPTPDEAFKQAAKAPIGQTLPLATAKEALHPLALELLNAISEAELDDYQRTRLEKPTLPEVKVSKALARRTVQAFNALLNGLEPVGIRFRRFQGLHHTGYFERNRDRWYLAITEDLVRPDGSKAVSPYAWPREKANPCGYLTFAFKAHQYYERDPKEWCESAKISLERTLAEVVAEVREHFLDLQAQREQDKIESARRHAEWKRITAERERQEAIRLQKEKEEKHAAAVAAAKQSRRANLVKAAQDWRFCGSLLEFVEQCERHWKSQSQPLTSAQLEWLAWAKQTAGTASTFPADFPDPAKDGGFDPSSIPFGGPYPASRDLDE